MPNVIDIAKNAKYSSVRLMQISTELKNYALSLIADELEANKDNIISANNQDLANAARLLKTGKLNQSTYNRLKLDDNKINSMIQGVRDVINIDDPVNKILFSKEIADGVVLEKVSCPRGVIGVIFEARPDVISQIISLAIKSSNALILKGGSEAVNTNTAIFKIIDNALSKINEFPENSVNLIFSRDDVAEMLKADEYINLIIPRGSNSLVKYIKENTKIPVLGHSDGVCHIFVDKSADISNAINIIIDAKCQYPSACNSVETVLIDSTLKNTFLPLLLKSLKTNDVIINSDEQIKNIYPKFVKEIVTDWHKEYGSKIISLKLVSSVNEAIEHINKYGSGHTDCIITEDNKNADKFMMLVDSAGVYKNISTRFADGFRYGFGAEVGISTNKIHARGPVGLDGLTIYKYRLSGHGEIVQDFISGNKHFNK